MKIRKTFMILFSFLLSILMVTGCDDEGSDYAYPPASSGYSAGDMETYSADSVSFSMAYVPGGKIFPTGTDDSGTATVSNAYWIGETEATYQLWYAVYTWATTGSGAPGAGEYTFANPGREGSDGTDGAAPTAAANEPVVFINWRDAMVWCNALTEWYNSQNGTCYECVYYYDAACTAQIRDSQDGSYGTSVDVNAGSFDNPFVLKDADGFRLPASKEWELAARYIADANNDGDITDTGEYYPGNYASGADADYDDTTGAVDYDNDGDVQYSADVAVFPTSSTAAVKSKVSGANALGLYDMSGNVWEWCFDWHPDNVWHYRLRRGGSWHESSLYLQVGSEDNSSVPWYESTYYGLRFVRISNL